MSGKALEHLSRLVERAESPTYSYGLVGEDVLYVEVNGRYVDVLVMTGGPHFEVQLDFVDAESGEYWFENEPIGGVATYKDWGECDIAPVGGMDARVISAALSRSDEQMQTEQVRLIEVTDEGANLMDYAGMHVMGQVEPIHCTLPNDIAEEVLEEIYGDVYVDEVTVDDSGVIEVHFSIAGDAER